MDIKPFVMPDVNIWTDISPAWIILIAVSCLIVAVAFKLINKIPDIFGVLIIMTGIFGALMGGSLVLMAESQNIRTEAYKSHVAQVKDSLANDGFKIVSGTLNLHPNTQSDLLLEYQGKNFDCTLFAPEDLNTNIVFSCGEAKLTLEQIKESK